MRRQHKRVSEQLETGKNGAEASGTFSFACSRRSIFYPPPPSLPAFVASLVTVNISHLSLFFLSPNIFIKCIGRSTRGRASICLKVNEGRAFAREGEFVVHGSEGWEVRELEREWLTSEGTSGLALEPNE